MTVGYGLGAAVGIAIFGYALHTVYALVGSSLGSRTGQTHALLTRSIFGSGGSVLVSLFVLIAPLAWVGSARPAVGRLPPLGPRGAAEHRARRADDLQHLFGLTGISVFARYLVMPILILWCIVAAVRSANVKRVLASRRAAAADVPPGAVVDIASVAEGTFAPDATPVPAS